MIVEVPVSIGELLDKLSILRIKLKNFSPGPKRDNVQREHDALQTVADTRGLRHPELETALDQVNGRLWKVEDELRVLETRQDFGMEFIALARAVYYTNDERAALKQRLNTHFGSSLVEEKQYVDYRAPGATEPGGSTLGGD
ncbi:MAG: hypothetical protein KC518_02605 [Candidatus Cloacimonetes bacterium]|nr:hypothetical protein [Candidatus Cloacimonadota bacterium]